MQLADSYWPRSGFDRGNRSHVPIPGPEKGEIVLEVTLPRLRRKKKPSRYRGGCVISDDATLRVIFDCILSAITVQGELLWSRELKETDGKRCHYCSLPVALQAGQSLVTLQHTIIIVDPQGNILEHIRIHGPLDDSGPSPNITYDHHLIVTCIMGEVLCLQDHHLSEIGCFGYDILPPAIYDDDSLAISGYYGTGFCRVRQDGQKVWTTELHEADLLPTINRQQISAVGSRNDNVSAFVSSDGVIIGKYERASIFAEYSATEWIALSHDYVAKLSIEGNEIWGYPLQVESNWRNCQPIVDGVGHIYISTKNSILCLNAQGNELFAVALSEPLQGGLSLIAPGHLACISMGKLCIIR